MANRIYLAFYKYKRSFLKEPFKALADVITRFFTNGAYSHCEIAVERLEFTQGDHYEHRVMFDCYSASVRDGGVRCKQIDLPEADKWDLVCLENVTEAQIKSYFSRTSGAKYDWWGIVLGVKQKRSKYFCSEWCFNAIYHSEEGWRFSPNQLAAMVRKNG